MKTGVTLLHSEMSRPRPRPHTEVTEMGGEEGEYKIPRTLQKTNKLKKTKTNPQRRYCTNNSG